MCDIKRIRSLHAWPMNRVLCLRVCFANLSLAVSDACSWPGISCDPATLRITGISINSTGLGQQITGGLHDFSALGALQVLQLPGNHLSGTLPAAWGLLSMLQEVDLTSNALNGTLPAEWGLLSQMWILRLSMNSFQVGAHQTQHQPPSSPRCMPCPLPSRLHACVRGAVFL